MRRTLGRGGVSVNIVNIGGSVFTSNIRCIPLLFFGKTLIIDGQDEIWWEEHLGWTAEPGLHCRRPTVGHCRPI